jgi:restriction system protein
LVNWSSQVWPFVKDIAQGDWVVMPSKLQSGLYFGELTSNYHFEAAGPNPYYHWRSINWFSGLIPRTVFPQDLLYSFGAFMTICRIQRNDAEARVKAMAANKWQAESVASSAPRTPASSQGGSGNDEAADAANVNLEELAADQIERLIEARFKGHELASLVEAILQAEGYTTYRSPAGADGGAETCLFVSWGGFRPNVQKELARDFFRVRLWSRKELLEMLFVRYNQLPEEIRLALPLKRVWMVAQQND